jgi:hypothetical protein
MDTGAMPRSEALPHAEHQKHTDQSDTESHELVALHRLFTKDHEDEEQRGEGSESVDDARNNRGCPCFSESEENSRHNVEAHSHHPEVAPHHEVFGQGDSPRDRDDDEGYGPERAAHEGHAEGREKSE